jgi:UDP-2,3-diacylglucosamine pyrophosphatase LpxH
MSTPASTTPQKPQIPDTLTVDVTPGTTVLITSDLHFAATRTEASAWAEDEVGKRLEGIQGAAILILAGDVFELWAGTDPDAAKAMESHPRFATGVRDFAAHPQRRVLALPGNHDGKLGWDPVASAFVQGMGAELTFAVDLVLLGSDGPERVRVEHGHRWDPANVFQDPRDPLDTPLGQHIVQELLPDLATRDESGVFSGVEALEDPRTFPSFVASRVFYRRMLKETRWLLVPLILAIGIHYGITLIDAPARLHLTARDFVVLDVAIVALAMVTAVVIVIAGRHAWKSATETGTVAKRGKEQNDNARTAAQDFVQSGYRGVVSGHTHHPELTDFGNGFYANSGSGTRVVEQIPAYLSLPHVYEARLQLSWVELAATEQGWTASLVVGGRPIAGTFLERLASPKSSQQPRDPAVIASYP